MNKNSSKQLSARALRIILLATMVIIIIIGCAGFYFIQAYLYDVAVNVSHKNEDAQTSSSDIIKWDRLKDRLADEQEIVDRTAKIVAESQSYQYQDQIIEDLNAYAARAGVSITAFNFQDSSTTDAASPKDTSETTIPGLNSTTVSVSLVTPVNYRKFLEFVHSIEQNLTKMQLASISMTQGATAEDVTVSVLDIKVYTK